MSTSQTLDALRFPLWGSRLIEASAGTGKTWTIAALYLRLVLGHGGPDAHPRPLRPGEILVMTFTRAATRELSDRIRARLIEAARCFRGELQPAPHDALLRELMATYPEGAGRQAAAWRLAMAAEGMDEAAVHTIDAWCQRMLREHAFDSGNLFDETLVADEARLLTEAVQDYWRQQVYPLRGEWLDRVLSIWPGVEDLAQDMKALLADPPEGHLVAGTLQHVIATEHQQWADAVNCLRAGWSERITWLRGWFATQLNDHRKDWNGNKLRADSIDKWMALLQDWADAPEPIELNFKELGTGARRLTPDGLLDARGSKAGPIELPPVFADAEQMLAELQSLPVPDGAARLHAAATVHARLKRLKRQTAQFGFADMVERLDQALGGSHGERLRQRILTQYPVALIDEFQDTSPRQFRLFDQLYRTADNDPQTALLLIGDPKQSIYGFRGADIHAYLQARRATEGRHYMLGTNHRSTAELVGAVNHWFARAEDRPGPGAFLFREDGDNPVPFLPVAARGRAERFVSAEGPVPALQIVHATESAHIARSVMKGFAARCAEQIVQWLNDPHAGFEQAGGRRERLRPADIAVLVRTGREAAAVRRELRLRNVASVYLSEKDSVFRSQEARDLLFWLRAVAQPLDARLVRAALATRTVGLSLDELGWLAASDEAFDARSEQLRRLQTVWQTQGVLTMLRQSLHVLDLPARSLAEVDGERRLTNVLHLAELLQQASTRLEGEQALIHWLAEQIDEDGSTSDEQVVRLESDADLVKIVTMHKSKGLEYPVVCVPFGCAHRAVEKARKGVVRLPGADGQRTLHLEVDDTVQQLADRERLREDLRLLYVALTRPRHALWFGFAALKAKGKSTKCVTHLSATGYLLGGQEAIEPSGWQTLLEQLAHGQPDIALQPAALDETRPLTPLQAREAPPPLAERAPYDAWFDRRWSVGSFSALVRALAGPALPLGDRLPRPADDEAAEAPSDAAHGATPPALIPTSERPIRHRFTKGALAGNFLHDQLEWLATEDFALATRPQLAERLRQRCARAGHGEHAEALVAWLQAVLLTPLPGPEAPLAALQHLLPEMEFWLPAQRLPAASLDAVCRAHILPGLTRPELPERELHGMLMGFADLVFEHEGRYWVLDYKSNHLGDTDAAYHREALAGAMLAHRYDVQAAIYLLALHRLLRERLGEAYDPAQHLGGAVYLFLRGTEGPERGVCQVPATPALMAALDHLLDTEAPHREVRAP
ncbi:exodeoxyribonuclease V subunit beta [uncultured Aquabacterium sp.]|jgi:exodeoxyribonuclease V beta subunit|uniref:exodeoxyribonuclease V subunit beta n=1 Tax=uncultured Aquabacterium sp. TaxID=158753 RepID=UPI0026340CB6|nr:exodeoxyribonuclease V subunit beta [uncultured Aquabacterium sp.]